MGLLELMYLICRVAVNSTESKSEIAIPSCTEDIRWLFVNRRYTVCVFVGVNRYISAS